MSEAEPVIAAGGLLERAGDDGRLRIAIVHRTRYLDGAGGRGDWVLPKGKQEPGESLEETAVREVGEETGFRGRIAGPSFPCTYEVKGIPKVVSFFRMQDEARTGTPAAIDASEVQEVIWLEPVEAVERLTYRTERDVLRRAYGL